jgi:hypothetical protein
MCALQKLRSAGYSNSGRGQSKVGAANPFESFVFGRINAVHRLAMRRWNIINFECAPSAVAAPSRDGGRG